MINPLLDKDFLKELDMARDREVHVRLIALNLDEEPIETLEGRATGGSLNIDGKSSVRRTCSLTMVANELDINDFYWGLKSKFKLEIGLRNNIDDNFPDIIWFPCGTFLITSFTTSQNVSSYNISISGKDKMAMLNGEMGGAITSLTADLGKYDQYDDKGNKTIKKYPIKDIIREGVHEYGNEPFHNIIINDLDDYGLELKEYRGDTPLYLFREINLDEFVQMTINGETEITVNGKIKKLNQLIQTEDYTPEIDIEGAIEFNFDLRNTFTEENYQPTKVVRGGKEYFIAKVETGDTPGYTLTELVFAGELILSVGDAFTDALDKIVNMLGNFEYFYDVNGRFIFQKKKTYTSTSWNNLTTGDDGIVRGENAALTSALSYSFEDSKLVQTFSNNPDLMNLRNDFAVWGTRKSATGKELPVHMRYAIDKKPTEYTTIEVTANEAMEYNEVYGENKKSQLSKKYSVEDGLDWREIIYQMALDYRRHNHLDGFEAKLAIANQDLYPTGKTGYEQYYIDLEGFWRQLYNPDYKPEYQVRNFTEDKSKTRYVKGFVETNQLKKEFFNEDCTYHKKRISKEGEMIDDKDYNISKKYVVKQEVGKNHQYFYYNPFGTDLYGIVANKKDGVVRNVFKLASKKQTKITLPDDLSNPDIEEDIIEYCVYFTLKNEKAVKDFYFAYQYEENDYDQYYCFYGDSDEYLVKFLDTVKYNKAFYTDSEASKFAMDGYDLKNKIVYLKDGKNYKRYIDYMEEKEPEFKAEKVFIQITSNSYAPVLDYFKIFNLSEEEQDKDWEDIYILENRKYKKVKIDIKEAEDRWKETKNLKEIISYDRTKIFYSIYTQDNTMQELKETLENTNFYIRKERDITDKILYTEALDKDGNKYWTPYNNTISAEDRQNIIWIEKERKKGEDGTEEITYMQPVDALKVNRDQLYIKTENGCVLFKKSAIVSEEAKKKTLYKINDENIYYNVKEYNNPMKKLYIKDDKYQRYLDSPNFNMLGKVSSYYPVLAKTGITYYESYSDFDMDENSDNKYWNYSVQNAPETLNFWFDFLDSDSELSQFSVPVVGNRPKAINDSSVKAIYFRDIPNVLFTDNIKEAAGKKKSGYNYVQLQKGMQALFTNSSQGKSAKDVIEENIYNHAYCTESISATVIPVYYLEPNTRIFIRDDNSKINGEYILNNMSISLNYNGMMNIGANKAIERILY